VPRLGGSARFFGLSTLLPAVRTNAPENLSLHKPDGKRVQARPDLMAGGGGEAKARAAENS
jgi:hypothetical protein